MTFESAFLTDVQVADHLHLSVKTLRRWRLAGEGPHCVRFGGSVRYPAAELQSWVSERPSARGAQREAHAPPSSKPSPATVAALAARKGRAA